tara:strand:+ start:14156 stop:14818 length:663 start_codon:yes stop_codon:yes gene_type:complete
MNFSTIKLVLPTNTSGRDFVVGDIHGHVSKLKSQLQAINFNESCDRLICVGDLIDRGPESAQALDLLDEPWFFSVIGNHEFLMLSGLKLQNSNDRLVWIQNGGEWITTAPRERWDDWFSKIESLPVGIEVTSASGRRYGIVHADYPARDWADFEGMSEDELQRCIWSRTNFRSEAKHTVKGIDTIFHGHSVSQGKLQLGNRVYVEPGVYMGADFIITPLE